VAECVGTSVIRGKDAVKGFAEEVKQVPRLNLTDCVSFFSLRFISDNDGVRENEFGKVPPVMVNISSFFNYLRERLINILLIHFDPMFARWEKYERRLPLT
jgi:hypothetical protein